MAIRDTWRRALEYFGLVEGDYIEEGEYYEEGDTGTDRALDDTAVAPREPVGSAPRRRGGGAGRLGVPRSWAGGRHRRHLRRRGPAAALAGPGRRRDRRGASAPP